ncbi:alpha-B-crystallin-like protein [Dinothrombium tinctorium]|uniref:Alpha-B-crystallin-like protein n=1 Tax=Dinothrombium tinctorium TaxID=1965070 RepID=A0A3S3P9S2_9ACAR|nr:alpha-B-crystallin-like protein [Dinothrombium tinctorium]RWS04855.1 alpha-B-crystallin-like protein [Dinothrombium tinctorium]
MYRRTLSSEFGEKIYHQNFGSPIDANDSLNSHFYHRWPRWSSQHFPDLNNDKGYSYVRNDSRTFQVMLDCCHFNPEEITVKIADQILTINAKHDVREDEHGRVSREFTRYYDLPRDVEAEKAFSTFRSDGILVVNAPKKATYSPMGKERVIPIEMEAEVKSHHTVNGHNDVHNGRTDTGTNP